MSNRERLISLLQYLYKNTDDEHQVDTGELTFAVLGEDTPAKRKTIKEDIQFLEKTMSIDIITHKGSPDRFQWGNRLFDTAEIKLLADLIASSKMLTPNMCDRIVDKLVNMVSIYDREKVKNHLYVPQELRCGNVQIFYTIDKIVSAMDIGKRVQFQYLQYNMDKVQNPKEADGKSLVYEISPYGLVLENGRYYLVGYSHKIDEIRQFRMDRITNLVVLDDKIHVDRKFDMQKYLYGAFKMYAGRCTDVVIRCKSVMMNRVIDHFGPDVEIEPVTEDEFLLKAKVQISCPFFGWLFEAGTDVKILEPEQLANEYKDYLCEVLQTYNESV